MDPFLSQINPTDISKPYGFYDLFIPVLFFQTYMALGKRWTCRKLLRREHVFVSDAGIAILPATLVV
jgi:hypothetical protein